MRVDDCEMLDVAPEPGAVYYRIRHRRTGEVVTLHILTGAESGGREALSLLNLLPPEERSCVLDHGKDGPLTYFVTQGLSNAEGLLAWLKRSSQNPDTRPPAASSLPDAMTPQRMQRLRDLFEEALKLPRADQPGFISRQCAGDRAVEARLLRMLGADARDKEFLEVPAPEQLAAGLAEISSTAAGAPPEIDRTEPIELEFATGILIGDRYLVEREVGRGGFGIIYLAQDRQLNDRRVVLKVRKSGADPMNPDLMKRFKREVASLASLAHPSIVGVLDVGETAKGTPYFVMPYVAGNTLRQALKLEGRMPLPRVAAIVRQISYALTVAHGKGICHRDLKPENIMLQDLGDGEELAIIIDFGIATMKEGDNARTAFTRGIGTVAYMPPEQREGRPIPASDTYALAVMSFEMIAGKRPDRPSDSHRQKVSALRRDIPKAADAVIAKAMSANPAARPKRTRDFGDELWAAILPARPSRRGGLFYWALIVLAGLYIGLVIQRLLPHHTPADVIGYTVNRGSTGFRIRLAAPHAGHVYVIEEMRSGDPASRFDILFPDLSYFGSSLRYLNDKSVEFQLPRKSGHGPRTLWALWSEDTVAAAEALGRAQRASREFGKGLEAPQIDAWVKEYRRNRVEQISPGLLMQMIVVPGDEAK